MFEGIPNHVTQSMYACIVFTMVNIILSIVDLITGISLSLHYNHRISSKLWGRTTAKVMGSSLYLMLVILFLHYIFAINWVYWIVVIPIVLSCLKEYISIGENLALRFGEKPYSFKIIDILFTLIETVFFSWVHKLGSKISSTDELNVTHLKTQKHILLDSEKGKGDAGEEKPANGNAEGLEEP